MRSRIQNLLITKPNTKSEFPLGKSAAVSLILLDENSPDILSTKLLFIQRAKSERDPWSGQIGFPGGRYQTEDASLLQTAIRETKEEIGLSLANEHFVSSLSDVQGRRAGRFMDFYIQPQVFVVNDLPNLKLDEKEVSALIAVSLGELLDPKNHQNYLLERENFRLELPSIQLPNKEVLWGLSYIILSDFMVRFFQSEKGSPLPPFWRLYPA